MRAKEARDISISEFLDRSGIKPAVQRKSGRELWYSSPLRSGDSDPSFKVDTVKNLWFDFGMAKGGNVIDLVCELTHSTVKEALAILDRSGANSPIGYTRFKPSNPDQAKSSKKYQGETIKPSESSGQSTVQTSLLDEKIGLAGQKEKDGLELLQVAELQKPYLLDYLQSRKIDLAIARVYLKQIRFKPSHTVKSYYALGFLLAVMVLKSEIRGLRALSGLIRRLVSLTLKTITACLFLRALWTFWPFCLFIK